MKRYRWGVGILLVFLSGLSLLYCLLLWLGPTNYHAPPWTFIWGPWVGGVLYAAALSLVVWDLPGARRRRRLIAVWIAIAWTVVIVYPVFILCITAMIAQKID